MTVDLLLASLLLLGLARSLANYRARPEVGGRAVMAFLRAAAVLALVGVLVAPSWVRPLVDRLPPRLVLLVDVSDSMALPLDSQEPESGSRYAAALAGVEDLRRGYGEGFEVAVRTFAGQGSAPVAELPPAPRGPATDLEAALASTLRGLDDRTRAVFLLTDGRTTRGAFPAALARAAAVPLHGLQAGVLRDAARDVAVLGVEVAEEGFAGGSVKVRARVRMRGVGPGESVPLVLEVDGEEVATRAVRIEEGAEGEVVTVELEWVPRAGGLTALAVEVVEAGEGDRSVGDDRAESSILVHEEPLPILVLGGRPAPDLGFVRRVLRRDPRFALTVVTPQAVEGPVPLPAPGEPGALADVPLVLVSGFSVERFPEETQARLVEWVEQEGGTLVFLGNGPREWKHLEQSRFQGALPVVAEVDSPGLEKRLPVQAQAGASHPLTRILDHPQANMQAWQRLPPIAPGVRAVPATGARTYLAFPYYPRSIPLVASRPKGKGTLVTVNSPETYLWQTLAHAHGDEAKVHERFYAGLVAWAADPARTGGERLDVSRIRYRPGETLRVRWRGPAGATPPASVVMEPLDGEGEGRRVVLEPRGEGVAEGTATLEEPGFYQLRPLSGSADPQPIAVHPSREEVLRPTPDPAALRELAEASGGTVLSLDAEGLDPRQLPPVDASPVVRKRSTGVYWLDEPLVLALCLLLFCAEWWFRRRRNQV